MINKNNFFRIIFITLLFFGVRNIGYCQNLSSCKAWLHNDTLTLENGIIFQHFKWNNGNLIRLSFGYQATQQSIVAPDDRPAFDMGVKSGVPKGEGHLQVSEQSPTKVTAGFLKVEVIGSLEKLDIRHVFRIFPLCPAIACELYVKGKIDAEAINSISQTDLKNIETDAMHEAELQKVIIERVLLKGAHWKARSVEFFDETDHNNNLIQIYDRLSYIGECQVRGNLLLLENSITKQRFFMLKEAPCSIAQLYYPGYDFTLKKDEVNVFGPGVVSSDINDSTWTRAYGIVIGLSETNDESGILSALRQYQQTVRTHIPERDDMIMMNTWGDRSLDSRVNEKFILAELDAATCLGIDHFQIDDGWQTGRSPGSVFNGGSFDNIWRNPDYWKPDPIKFPKGLASVVKKGKKLGIEICLWFNPSPDNSNANWEKDAKALINL